MGDNAKIIAALKESSIKWKGFGYDYNELEEDEQVKALFNELTKEKKLEWLSLKGNEVPEETQEYIRAKIEENEMATKVDFESDMEEDEADEQDGKTPDVIEFENDQEVHRDGTLIPLASFPLK